MWLRYERQEQPMTETVLHVVGHVGTDVDHRKVGEGTDLSTFRLATTPRRWDRQKGGYVDGTTTWFTVQCWRALAAHVRDSIRRGDPVLVVGRLKTEEWTKDETRNSRIVLVATAVGHDLSRGVSSFRKAPRPSESPTDEPVGVREALEEIERAESVSYEAGEQTGDLAAAS
jgi:single-strand DNA-binding protein